MSLTGSLICRSADYPNERSGYTDPGHSATRTSASRTFGNTERVGLKLCVEAFNVFHHQAQT